MLIGDRERAGRLYELVLPYAERNLVTYTLQPFGPVALRLGMVASMLSRWEEAERHFGTARRRCELLGARSILARVAFEHARMLAARGDCAAATERLGEAATLSAELDLAGLLQRIAALRIAWTPPAEEPSEAVFRRDGDVWAIAYGGDAFRLRHVKGLTYIGDLLAAPGRDVYAVELAQAAEGISREAQAVGSLAATGPVLDTEAKAAYRRRLDELGEELEQARSWGDPERVAHAEEEIDALTTELTQAIGLGGRDRATASPGERARVSVTKAIRSAIRAIERQSPALGEHLTASIHTGQFCSYAPPGELPPRWTV